MRNLLFVLLLLLTVAVVLAHTLQLFQLRWRSIASSKAEVKQQLFEILDLLLRCIRKGFHLDLPGMILIAMT
jgi:Flp pilus assembly protein TadB